MIVHGTLRTGERAEMIYAQKMRHGRVVWTQRALSTSAAHLNRDYVRTETFEQVVNLWFPCDWRSHKFVRTEANTTTKKNWGDEEEGDLEHDTRRVA